MVLLLRITIIERNELADLVRPRNALVRDERVALGDAVHDDVIVVRHGALVVAVQSWWNLKGDKH